MAIWVEEGEARLRFEKEAKELVALLEAQLEGKKFFGGDRPGYLDVAASALGPWRCVIEELNGVTLLSEDEHPNLCRWSRDYCACEDLKPCMPDREKLLAYFTKNFDRYKAAVNATLSQSQQ
jgi:glutathione S-transferase